MLSKNIIFKNFQIKKKIKDKKKIKKILEKELIISSPLLNSFKKKYKYSFKKNIIKNYKSYKNINLIGMGGSILGTRQFMIFWSLNKKNIKFFNNLDNKIKIVPNEKS